MRLDHIKTLLKSQGKTQAELADYLGIGKPAVSLMLSGKRKISIKEAFKLSIFLGIQIEDVIPKSEKSDDMLEAPVIPISAIIFDMWGVHLMPPNKTIALINGPTDTPSDAVAAIVRSKTMYPFLRDSDLVVFGGEKDIHSLVGADCICTVMMPTEREIFCVIHEIREKPNHADIWFYNMPPVPNVEIKSARPVYWIRRNTSHYAAHLVPESLKQEGEFRKSKKSD